VNDNAMTNAPALPGLQGLAVIEVSQAVEGAYCARLLADAGADVIKVEPPEGDPMRRLGPFPNGIPEENASGLFHYLNANKRAVSLNLATSAGTELFQRLVKTADILISDYSPSELENLGLLYEQAKEYNPALIACSVTPFGLTGPYRDNKADDIVVLSLGGMTAATPGFPDYVVSRDKERPLRAETYAAGIISGATAAGAILTALFARMLDGEGRQIDVSQQEAVASTMIRDIASYSYAGIVSGRRTEEEQSGTAYAPNVYLPCKDGMVVIVTASEDGWKKLVEIMGSPEWCEHEEFQDTASRARNINSLLANLVEWTKSRTGAEITDITQSNGLPCAHVLRISEVVNSNHTRERAAFVDVEIGGRACRMPAPPFKISGVFGEERTAAPAKGKDNASVFCGLLGVEPSDLPKLRGMGVI
jgi:crotonobetainyl-CoA:carnitine CoA-transferase CaiB-like acyl-CoA transferase